MISGATDTLSTNLQQSQLDYRAQLEGRQQQGKLEASDPSNPVASQPSGVPKTEPTDSPSTLGEIEVAAQDLRDQSRQAVFNADVTRPEQGNQDISEPVDPVSTQPVDPVTSQPVDPEESPPLFVAESEQPEQTTAEKIEETSQDIRDQSRQAAVHAFEMQNAQLQVDTYVNASSETGNEDDVSTQTIDPVDAYEASMKTGRRQALMSAFEKAALGETTGAQLNVVI